MFLICIVSSLSMICFCEFFCRDYFHSAVGYCVVVCLSLVVFVFFCFGWCLAVVICFCVLGCVF